ncbi:hypothetical protein VTK56DRAFT_5342 [Thermocarpiscus australiensis]
MGIPGDPAGTPSVDQPFLPSISRLASLRRAIVLPWGSQPIGLGTPFSSKRSTSPDGPFLSRPAFDRAQLAQASMRYEASPNAGTYEEHTTTLNSHSSEHLSAGIGVSIGGSFLGGSVTGEYDKAVLENNNSHKISQSANVRRGHLKLAVEPLLSDEAHSLLSKDGIAAFEAAYGDYYVAGLTLGADCGICISFSQHDRSEAESWSITVTVRFLFMSASHTWSDARASTLNDVQMTTLGYDSLTGKNINLSTRGEAGVQQLRTSAAELMTRSETIVEEVEARLQKLGLRDKSGLGISDLQSAQASQLVVGLILCPYTGLMQVAAKLPPKW